MGEFYFTSYWKLFSFQERDGKVSFEMLLCKILFEQWSFPIERDDTKIHSDIKFLIYTQLYKHTRLSDNFKEDLKTYLMLNYVIEKYRIYFHLIKVNLPQNLQS